MSDNKKFGFWSIVLLGINGVIGSGIYLLPGKAMKIIGPGSIWIYIFDTLLVMSMALCFAEVGGLFDKNGGPYVYAKEAFGEFVGFEVGIMKWAISIIAWATMAVGFATALSKLIPQAATPFAKNLIATTILVGLGLVNIAGVKATKYLNNIVTVAKLLPLILFVIIGIFFIKGGNFTPMFPNGTSGATIGSAAILIFYAFTGFESIAVAAEDMDEPQKNVPKAIIVTMILSSIVYILVQIISVGILGGALAESTTPVADAAKVFMGGFGEKFVAIATLLSIGGINIAASFNAPRSGVALAEDGILPKYIAKKNKHDVPYIAVIITVLLAIPVAVSGTFTQLAMISVISRFAQYIPTCLSVIVFRKRGMKSTYTMPFGSLLPIISVMVSIWLLTKATKEQILWGLGALVIGIPLYFILKWLQNRDAKLTQSM
ncbi:APC family permease [Thermobrachium celere]|uniref:Amino acid permease n=1 Tax=Thermobrachium celere DSM 8682 TaxID=941824 RepID=R7RMP7_9CLOT|nr:APC family permease [Thermobrachium celere]CDF57452.1 hypothetical protein TCEL_01366 [Thermobrachium celere DSM 8682]